MPQRLGDRGQVLRAARADHDLGYPLIGQQPAEREPGQRGAAVRGDRLQPVQRVEGRAGDELGVRLGPLGHPRPGRVRRAAPVLAGQPAAGQRAERQVGHAPAGAQREQVRLVLPCQQRVAVLHGARRARLQGGGELGRVEVAHPVRADQAAGLGGAERPEDFGQRHVRVVLVREIQLDVADSEPVQARAELAGDPVRLQPAVRACLHRVVRLGGEPRPDPARGHPAADRPLAAAAAVGVGGVEPVDPGRPGRVHQRERLVLGQPPAEELRRRADSAEVPAAQRDARDSEPRTFPQHQPRRLPTGRHHPSGAVLSRPAPGSASPRWPRSLRSPRRWPPRSRRSSRRSPCERPRTPSCPGRSGRPGP